MADFENYPVVAARIALEIERKMIALEVDWHNDLALRNLAVQIMAHDPRQGYIAGSPGDEASILKELSGLVGLMLRTMEESAQGGEEVSGSDAWKALARALWATKEFPSSKSVTEG